MNAVSSTATQVKQLEQPLPFPTQKEVIAAIIRDAAMVGIDVNRNQAKALDDMFAAAAKDIRAYEGGDWRSRLYYLTPSDMHGVHDVLGAVVPDERVMPEPGSAHELLGRRHLQGSELTFVHTFGEARGGRYCAVAIAVDTTDAA